MADSYQVVTALEAEDFSQGHSDIHIFMNSDRTICCNLILLQSCFCMCLLQFLNHHEIRIYHITSSISTVLYSSQKYPA